MKNIDIFTSKLYNITVLYRIADLTIKFNNRYPYTDRLCKDYVTDSDNCDISVSVSEEELAKEKELSPDYSDGYIENICLYRKLCSIIPEYDRFLLHSCIVEYGGNGYAFLGHSGAGKSTHSSLWLKYIEGSKILNGDKPIIGYNGEEFIAYGTPWNGKEGRGYNGKAPIKGLCFIEQAKENKIEKISKGEAAQRLFYQVLLMEDESCVVKTLELIDKLVKTIPTYVLYCDISCEAAMTSFNEMTGGKI